MKSKRPWEYHEEIWNKVEHKEFYGMKTFVLDVLVAYEELTSEDQPR